MKSLIYGYRILGPTSADRRLVDWPTAFSAYASCDPQAKTDHEAYLSAFTFGDDFREYLTSQRTTKGFSGPCAARCLWFDIDRDGDRERATLDARRLAMPLVDRYSSHEDDLLIFFSGSKGFHLGLPTSLCGAAPSVSFHRAARQFAEHVAGLAGIAIDVGIYDKVRAFRAPNCRHPKTGLHKRRLSFDELMGLATTAIVELAREPMPFDIPVPAAPSQQAAADWLTAEAAVARLAEANARRRDTAAGEARLNRQTLEFIRDGATQGDRHRLLFSAAANLAEFDCPPALAHALLSEAALDSGLAPKEVHRQVECGLDGPSSVGVAVAPVSPETEPLQPVEQRPAVTELPRNPPPEPPPGAALYLQDGLFQPCAPQHATRWTWNGATRWFDVRENPIPNGIVPKDGAA